MKGKTIPAALMTLALLCAAAFAASLWLGGSAAHVDDFILSELRLPKSITAVIVGSSLAASGLVLQVVFRNPLAGPYVLGVSSGASLLVAASVMGAGIGALPGWLHGRAGTTIAAVTGSLAVTFLIAGVSTRVRSNTLLLLMGIMLAQVCGALQTVLEYFANPENLKLFSVWGMGALGNVTRSDLSVMLPVWVVCIGILIMMVKPLNALLLGDAQAQNTGIDPRRMRLVLLVAASVLTGLCTAFCGPIAFVGIAMPVLARLVFRTSAQGVQLLASTLLGSLLMLVADVLCHRFGGGIVFPINMITTLVGAPIVIFTLFRSREW